MDEIALVLSMIQSDAESYMKRGVTWFFNTAPVHLEPLDVKAMKVLRMLFEANEFDLLATMANLATLQSWLPLFSDNPSFKQVERPLFGKHKNNIGVIEFMNRAEEATGEEMDGFALYHTARRADWWLTLISKWVLGTRDMNDKAQEEEE